MCGYTDESIGVIEFKRTSPAKITTTGGPPTDNTNKSASGMILIHSKKIEIKLF